MKKLLIYSCALILSVRSQDFTKYNCQECIANLGKQCLLNNDMSSAVCCDPTISFKMQPDACKSRITYSDGSIQMVDLNNTLCVNAASTYAVKNPFF